VDDGAGVCGEPRALPGPDPAAQLISQARRAQEESVALARSLFSRWLERVAGLASGQS